MSKSFIVGVALFGAFTVAFLWSSNFKGNDPLHGCSLVSMEKTGKTKKVGTLPRKYETIRRWDCPDGKKTEVVYLNRW